MKRKTIVYTGFFAVLVLIFFIVLNKIVPGFKESRFPPIGTVQPFDFLDQDGQHITKKDVNGKVFVAEYFFTTCQGICPVMNGNMKTIYDEFRDRDGFLILSHTCDPANDSVGRLKVYADSLGVDTRKWLFLTGRKDSLYNMARFSYKIDDPNNNLKDPEDDFLHTQYWALVDRDGNIRKVYDGLKRNEINKLKNDIEELLDKKL
ncbi:MAG: SCO family protein [Terrimonas sp.]|nr:SCO family protein [Terrimonas sp.]